MSGSLVAATVALLSSLLLVPTLRKYGNRYGLHDKPSDDALKIHGKPVPWLGGIAVFISFFLSLGATSGFRGWDTSWTGVGGAATGALMLGLWDDLRWKGKTNYRPAIKFGIQVSVSVLIAAGIALAGVRVMVLPFVVPGVLLAAFYVFGGMNAVNMQDGIDGLAGSLVALSLGGFAVLAALSGGGLGPVLPLALLGGVGGFLVFNKHPASIFMGDSGSHMLGAMLAILAISFTSEPYNLRWFVAPILVIGLPVFDAALAIVRRAWRRKPLFEGDRGHLYDWLMRRGLGVWPCVLVCGAVQAVLVTCGLLVALL